MGHRDLWLRAEAALQVVEPTQEQRQCLAEVTADYLSVVAQLEVVTAQWDAACVLFPSLKPKSARAV